MAVCCNAVNAGFVDPFDPVRDVTLDNAAFRLLGFSLMTGKLDWTLLKGLQVASTRMGNHDYGASDHKWLLVEADLHIDVPKSVVKAEKMLKRASLDGTHA